MRRRRTPQARRPRSPFGAAAYLILSVLAATLHAAEPTRFRFQQDTDELRITDAGQRVATYVWSDAKILRPYFKNICAPGGLQVTRNHPPVQGTDATDHAEMHPGIWLAFGDLSGHDFWRNKARVEHERFVESPIARAGEAAFTVANRYVATDGKLICRETCQLRWKAWKESYLLLWSSTFHSEAADFAFGDQEEMGLGIRVATPITVKSGGSIINSAGDKNEKATWGKTADWLEYVGTIQSKTVGLFLMPDPANFRGSWFHSRDYGLVVMNAFGRNAFTRGEKSHVVVKRGETFRVRYGVLVHASPSGESLDRAAAYEAFLAEFK